MKNNIQATTDPKMFDSFVEVEGVKLNVDPINRKRTEGKDNVMAIFWEEQPFTWQFIQPYVKEALAKSDGQTDFLDVGTGSGIFGILMAKHHNASVIAIDKSDRAIEIAQKNVKLNAVGSIKFQHQLYSVDSVPENSVKVIGLYPPYHLYPEAIANRIPQHARGGSDGQQEFINQLKISTHHLAEDGIIFFNQMCLGDENGPRFLQYISEFIKESPSIIYTNVFSPVDTRMFLKGVYGGRHTDYIEKTAQEYPVLYYTVGIIKKDGKGEIKEVAHNIDLHGRSWEDRIVLHHEIADHEYK